MDTKKSTYISLRIPSVTTMLFLVFTTLTGCTPYIEQWPKLQDEKSRVSDTLSKPKSIFVFLDGTGNRPDMPTNVRRLYNLIHDQNDPHTTGIYIEGVGSTKNELTLLSGMMLGVGMKERILTGYKFIYENYDKPDDKIYIFGFSRGAHEARALAGLISYSGLPKPSDVNSDDLMKISKGILNLTQEQSDLEYQALWKYWTPDHAPLLANKIKAKFKIETRPAQVTFLGVWDTVPGSWFKDYGRCKEKQDKRKGDRYKTDTYPAIREIAHAVSFDEKRSMFKPLLICSKDDNDIAKYSDTKVDEKWFPGAHADVGGGYEEPQYKDHPGLSSKGLPGLSLKWMLEKLNGSYAFKGGVQSAQATVQASEIGLAHWSYGDFPANLGSDCVSRESLLTQPVSRQLDDSVEQRKKAGEVPVEVEKRLLFLKYPVECPGP